MSFDSTFDYSESLTKLNSSLTVKQDQLNTHTIRLTLLEGVTGYTELINEQIQQCQQSIINLNQEINNINAIINEINTIVSLPLETKETLYYMYTIVANNNVRGFMLRIPFNYSIALNDPNIINLLQDTNNNSEVKILLAKNIYSKYNVRYPIMSSFF